MVPRHGCCSLACWAPNTEPRPHSGGELHPCPNDYATATRPHQQRSPGPRDCYGGALQSKNAGPFQSFTSRHGQCSNTLLGATARALRFAEASTQSLQFTKEESRLMTDITHLSYPVFEWEPWLSNTNPTRWTSSIQS